MIFMKCQRMGRMATILVMGMVMIMALGPVLVKLADGMAENRTLTYEHKTPASEEAMPEAQEIKVFWEEQTYTAVLPHETLYCYSDALPDGVEQVLTEGRDGELLCTARVTYAEGEEIFRERLSQRVIANPVTEVIALGTGLRQNGQHTGVVIADGTITLPTGERLTYYDSIQVRATGYTHTDAGCDMITSTGTTVRIGTVAVDPRYVPYGTRMFIVSNDGSYIYGISVAEDCGGAIKGDRMDLYFPTTAECFQFGRRNCTVYLLGGGE